MKILGDIPDIEAGIEVDSFRPATLFLGSETLVSLPVATHHEQYLGFAKFVNDQWRQQGLPALSDVQRSRMWRRGVDLFINTREVQIRPDPNRMKAAFVASEILEELYSKRNIRFLYAGDQRVRQAIRQRGELWRINYPPQDPNEIARAIEDSVTTVVTGLICYYCRVTGTRWLTYPAFAALETMPAEQLRHCLVTVRDLSIRKNKLRRPELAFFGVDKSFSSNHFADKALERINEHDLRQVFVTIKENFYSAVVDPAYLIDAPEDPAWRKRMFNVITGQTVKAQTHQTEALEGIPCEFFRQVHFLPGGRVERGEFVFDTIFDEFEKTPDDQVLQGLCNERIKGIIHNCIREFGSLEYINIGRLARSMSKRPRAKGHLAYIVELKHRKDLSPVVRIIRLQQYGVEQHLDSGKELLTAIMQAQDYTEYILDRRLGCWELGLAVPERFDAKNIFHTYKGDNVRFIGTRIWSTYYERDFIRGVATDKIPKALFGSTEFALSFAMLLGDVAAANLVVGRTTEDDKPIFDDGDEVLIVDEEGRPERILVADHAGTFRDYMSPLAKFADAYARPVNDRINLVPDASIFAQVYLAALIYRIRQIQSEYRLHRRAFDTLFKHCRPGEGTFRDRWQKVLQRIDATDPEHLEGSIRNAIRS